MSARVHPGAVRAPDIELGVPALLADINLRDIGLADFGTGEMDPGVAVAALDHGPSSKGLHAETGHKVPRIIICRGGRIPGKETMLECSGRGGVFLLQGMGQGGVGG